MAYIAERAERAITRVSKTRVAVAALATTATLLAGCSSQTKKEANPAPKTSTTTESGHFSSASYEINPQRNARIIAAVDAFGEIVVAQLSMTDSKWAPFQTLCTPGAPFSNTPGSSGTMSQGYVPTPGQNCYVEHLLQYGGQDIDVGADVMVGAGGIFNNQFEVATVSNANCATEIIHKVSASDPTQYIGWQVTVSKGRDSASSNTSTATSFVQAESIDSQSIACLAETKP